MSADIDAAMLKAQEEVVDEVTRGSLALLTMVAGAKEATRGDLYEWCFKPREQIDGELEFAAHNGFVVTNKAGQIGGKGGRIYLTQRGQERIMLYWIGRHGGATIKHMMDRFGSTRRQTAQILGKGLSDGHLRLVGQLKFEDLLYRSTRSGLDLVGWKRLGELRVPILKEGHLRACLDTVIELEKEYGPQGEHGLYWEIWGERELEFYNRGRKNPLASPLYYIDGQEFRKLPDILRIRWSRDGSIVIVEAIEDELTTKAKDVLDAILLCYSRAKDIDVVHYGVSPRAEGGVNDANLRLSERVKVEIESGGRDPGEPTEIVITPLPQAVVPARRRAPHYWPTDLAGSKDLYLAAKDTEGWSRYLRLDVLETVQWVIRNGVLTPDAVATWRGLPEVKEAEELLALAHGAEWLYYSNILRAQGGMFFATELGRHEVGLDMPRYEINFKSESHYFVTETLCINARVAAQLAVDFPDRQITGRWELRGDSLFAGEDLITVAMAKENVGYYKHPHLLISPGPESHGLDSAVLVMPYYFPGYKMPIILKHWLDYKDIGHLYLFIGDDSVSRAADKAIEKLECADVVTIKELPLSPAAEELIEDEEALKGCSLALESRTAWTNT